MIRQKTNISYTVKAPLNSFNIEGSSFMVNTELLQFPHSELNLVTKTKVSPTIYKYMQQSGQKFRPKSSTPSLAGSYRKHSS